MQIVKEFKRWWYIILTTAYGSLGLKIYTLFKKLILNASISKSIESLITLLEECGFTLSFL